MNKKNKNCARAAYVMEGSLGDSLISLPSLRLFLSKYSNAETMLISLGPSVELGAAKLFQGRLPFTKFVHIQNAPSDSFLRRISKWLKLALILRTNGIEECIYGIRSENLISIKRAKYHKSFLKMGGCKILADELNLKYLEDSLKFPNNLHQSISRDTFQRISNAIDKQNPIPFFDYHFPLTHEDDIGAKRWLEENNITSDRCIAVCVGSKSFIRWNINNYRSVLEGVINKFNVIPIFFGAANELLLAEAAYKNLIRYKLALGLSIGLTASLLKRCIFYIGNDTGTMHLAASVGTPCVSIFSARNPKGHWYPWGDNHIIFRLDIDCAGCELQSCEKRKLECLEMIQPNDVLQVCCDYLSNYLVDVHPNYRKNLSSE